MKGKKTGKAILFTILGIIVVLVAVVLIKTAVYPFAKVPKETAATEVVDNTPSVKALQRFSGGIQIPTVSDEIGRKDNNPFKEFQKYLAEVYPEIYKTMEYSTVNEDGMLFHWKGKDASLNPILFLSHYDVVPVVGYSAARTREANVFRPDDKPLPAIDQFSTKWDYHPFSGAVVDGRVYGRGTLDMKCMLFSVMEAADELIAQGFTPERDIWFAFGFDEEIGGRDGALNIAKHFKEQGVSFDAVYDEGGIISPPGLGGIDQTVALVGTAEKGFCTINITVHGTGGHSSMPPAKGSLVQAAEIMEKLNTDQLHPMLTPPIASFLDNVGGSMGYTSRMAIANKWMFESTLLKNLTKSPVTNALVRTTTAVTMAKGSDAPNVLASVAEVTVNYRILPGQTVADIVKHVEDVCDGYDVDIVVESSREPSNTSTEDARGFEVIKESLARINPEALVSSYLTIGGTDAYKYEAVSGYVYRFIPLFLNEYEQRTIHNENEHIKIADYGNMIAHFKYIMENF